MTDEEAFELISKGGATDFAKTIAVCAATGPHCMIGGPGGVWSESQSRRTRRFGAR